MTPTREDLELYVTGNYDGDVAALERAIAEDPKLAAIVAEEAKLDMLLRDAASAATFCPACEQLVREQRCDHCGAAVRPGGYTVERVLVSNAHGRMYVARDADGKRVALKELAFVQAPSTATVAAFEREAKFLRALEHPAIPRFCASFEEGQGVHTRYYLAQELVEGTPLDRLDDHWYSEAEIIDVAKQVLTILVYLQSLSPMVIHRDIKPANLVKRGDGSIALVDFGAAHVHGTTAGSTTIGTFGYMPIEQLAGIVDATTDCYALGATLLYLLTRQEPWRLAQTKTTVNVSAPLRAYLDKLTANDPRARFASAKEALAGLDKKEELVIIKKETSRPRWKTAAVAATAAALSAGTAVSIKRAHDKKSAQTQQVVEVDKGKLRLVLKTFEGDYKAGLPAKVVIDGKFFTVMKDETTIGLPLGKHQVKLLGTEKNQCEISVDVVADKEMLFECAFEAPETKNAEEPPPPRLHIDKRVSWTFNKSPLHDVMRLAAKSCGFNVVVPGVIAPKVTIRLADVPCDQAVEVMLENQGLDYVYNPAANLVRVATSSDVTNFDFSGSADHDEALPAGGKVNIDFKLAPLPAVLAMISSHEQVNLVVPDAITNKPGSVTILVVDAPWERVFDAVLDAQGLFYKYRKNGKIISVSAPEPDEPSEGDRVISK